MEHPRFDLDIHKERILIAEVESGRSRTAEQLCEIGPNEPGAISKLCEKSGVPVSR